MIYKRLQQVVFCIFVEQVFCQANDICLECHHLVWLENKC